MTRVKIVELKDHLSEHLRAVERGAELEITDRNRPIARIVPVENAEVIRLRPPTRRFSSLRAKRYRPARWQVSALTLLLEERRER